MFLLFDNLTIGLCMKGSLAVIQCFPVLTCTDLSIKSCSTSSLILIFSICSLLTRSLQSLQLKQRYDISVAAFSTWLNMFCCLWVHDQLYRLCCILAEHWSFGSVICIICCIYHLFHSGISCHLLLNNFVAEPVVPFLANG